MAFPPAREELRRPQQGLPPAMTVLAGLWLGALCLLLIATAQNRVPAEALLRDPADTTGMPW